MTAKCVSCSVEADGKPLRDGSPALPRSWKRWPDGVRCAKCTSRSWTSTVSLFGFGLDKQGWNDIHEAWREARVIRNRCVEELRSRDSALYTGENLGKLAPDAAYLYPFACGLRSVLSASSVNQVSRDVVSRYKRERWQVRTGRAVFSSYRSDDAPIPVPTADWSLEHDGERFSVVFRLGQRRVAIKIKQGPMFARQLAALRDMHDGNALRQSLAVARCRKEADRRAGLVRILVTTTSLAQGTRECGGVLMVTTSPLCLLRYVFPSGVSRDIGGQDVRRFQAAYVSRMRGLKNDRKHLRASGHKDRIGRVAGAADGWCRKRDDYMRTRCQQIAADVVGVAARANCSTLDLDLRNKEFLREFPWHQLATCIKNSASRHQIEVAESVEEDAASAGVVEAPLEALA